MNRHLFDGSRALTRCKHCGGVVHAIHRKNHLSECRAFARKKKLGRMAFEKDGKKLYAIAIQRFNGKEWLPEVHYTHGANRTAAKLAYLSSERQRKNIHIIDVGLAIGMFMNDRDGNVLSAT